MRTALVTAHGVHVPSTGERRVLIRDGRDGTPDRPQRARIDLSDIACVRCFVLMDTENNSSHSGVVWGGRGDAYCAS